MGLYDTLHVGRRTEQVKLWGKGLRWFHLGDVVGPPRGGLAPDGDYSVKMHSGGYVHVEAGVVTAWADEPGSGPVVSPRGEAVEPDVPWLGQRPVEVEWEPERCSRCTQPSLRLIEPGDWRAAYTVALAAGLADADELVAARPDPADRLDALRAAFADETGYPRVAIARAALLLGVEADPHRAGALLVQLLRETPRGAKEWTTAAGFVGEHASTLPLEHVVAALRLLGDALPTAEDKAKSKAQDEPEREWEPDPAIVAHPRMQRRQGLVALTDGPGARPHRPWEPSYNDLNVEAAATEAVRVLGGPALAGVLLRLWWHDIAATELVTRFLQDRLGRVLTPLEKRECRCAFDRFPGYLDSLTDEQVEQALADAVAAR